MHLSFLLATGAFRGQSQALSTEFLLTQSQYQSIGLIGTKFHTLKLQQRKILPQETCNIHRHPKTDIDQGSMIEERCLKGPQKLSPF